MSDTVHKRVPNFASSETELITTLVKRYDNVLENKRTDVVNNQIKDETWSKLAEDFNSTSGIYQRSTKTLRAKYEKNLKTKVRRSPQKLISYRRWASSNILNLTQEEEIIMELAGPSVEGLPARFDSDVIPECKSPLPVMAEASTSECTITLKNIYIDDDCNIEMEEKSKQHFVKGVVATRTTVPEVNVGSTPNRFLLKKKQSKPLTRRNPEAFTNTMGNYSDLSKKKQDLVNAQIQSVEEKCRLKKIEHELRCAHLQEKMKQESREHELRCELTMLDIKKRSSNTKDKASSKVNGAFNLTIRIMFSGRL